MAMPRLHPLSALPLLMALGALATPLEREPNFQAPPGRHGLQHRMPQHPMGPPAGVTAHPPHQHRPMAADADTTAHFHRAHRHAAEAYYALPEHQGFVPPGLAKKGGLPPGQSRLWTRGQPLPAGVVWYALPRSLELVLGPAPAGHRYVRVGADILLMALGTGLVVDAMTDLAR